MTANTTNIARIELFSTGGSIGTVTNQSAAVFSVSTVFLGVGLHPFYAVVTDQAVHHYQTQTISYRIIPPMTLTLVGSSPVVSWQTIPGCQYDLQSSTNLAAGFQTLATITATNSMAQWPIPATGRAAFYRVKLNP